MTRRPRPPSAFMEIGYGVFFYLSAWVGGFLGLVAVTRPRGGTYESQMHEDVSAIIIGTICGSLAWLWFKYSYLTPMKPPSTDNRP